MLDQNGINPEARWVVAFGNEHSADELQKYAQRKGKLERDRARLKTLLEQGEQTCQRWSDELRKATLRESATSVRIRTLPRPKSPFLFAAELGLILTVEALGCYLGFKIFADEPTWGKLIAAVSAAYVLTTLGAFALRRISRRLRWLIGFAMATMWAAFVVLRYVYFDKAAEAFLKVHPLPILLSISSGLITGAMVDADMLLYKRQAEDGPLRPYFADHKSARLVRKDATDKYEKALADQQKLEVQFAEVEADLASLEREFTERLTQLRWAYRDVIERYQGDGVGVPPSTNGGNWRRNRREVRDGDA